MTSKKKRKHHPDDGFFITCEKCEDHPPLHYISWGEEGFYGCPNYSKTHTLHTTVSIWKYDNEHNRYKKRCLEERIRDLENLKEISIGFSSLPETFRRACIERILDCMTTESLILYVRGVCKEWYAMVMSKIISSDLLSKWKDLELYQRVFHLRLANIPRKAFDGITKLLVNSTIMTDVMNENRFSCATRYPNHYVVNFFTHHVTKVDISPTLSKYIMEPISQESEFQYRDVMFLWTEKMGHFCPVLYGDKNWENILKMLDPQRETFQLNVLHLRHPERIMSKIKPVNMADLFSHYLSSIISLPELQIIKDDTSFTELFNSVTYLRSKIWEYKSCINKEEVKDLSKSVARLKKKLTKIIYSVKKNITFV